MSAVERLRERVAREEAVSGYAPEPILKALFELDERLEASRSAIFAESLLADHVPVPSSVASSAAIALCAVVLDEAEQFSRVLTDESVSCHAHRCRELYRRLCADAAALGREQAAEAKAAGFLSRSIQSLNEFQNAVAYELGAERSPDLALDALRARLREHREFEDVKTAVAVELGYENGDNKTLLAALKERLRSG